MATLDYVRIPPAATRLRSSTVGSLNEAANIQPAPKIVTSLPTRSPPPSLLSRRSSSFSLGSASLTSPTTSFLPQLMLSASMPPGTPNSPTNSPRKKGGPERVTLLSSKDPISLPIMTNNFKRFVAKVGPVFWLQDRIEEIIFWKRGWKVTAVWMAAYAFICYFPRLVLLLPHVALISIILASYPYPKTPGDPLYSCSSAAAESSSTQVPTAPPPPAEGTISWQANIQGIQNLMGAVADMHTLLYPYTYHLSLSPAHLSAPSKVPISTQPSTHSRSPYTPHIITLLVVSFVPLAILISLPSFPIRGVFLFLGLAPFAATHPYSQSALPLLKPLALTWLIRLQTLATSYTHAPGLLASIGKVPTSTLVQRLIDDDNLGDAVWGAEMRDVELWENERFGGTSIAPVLPPRVRVMSNTWPRTGPVPPTDSSPPPSGPAPAHKGWSKLNLRSGERSGWTRGRDGWSGVGRRGDLLEGEVSSNLTFSLAPGWAFVETEDWRKDLVVSWSDCSGDSDGWLYTDDAWLNPSPALYATGTGSLTRRRRWVRRIWYDHTRAVAEA